MKLKSAVSLLMLMIVGASFAQTSILGEKIELGVDAGVYFPSDSKIKNVFGSNIFSFGLHVGAVDSVKSGKIGFGLGLVDASKNGNKFYNLQGMAKYESTFGTAVASGLVPYYEIAAGLDYSDYSFDYNSNHYASKKILPTGLVGIGVIYNKTLKFSAEYDFFGSTDGFSFNGLELKLTYTFFKF